MTAQLKKATLYTIDKNKKKGTEIPVQFNPASLHFTIQSVSDRGKTPARQPEQHLGSGNLTLSLELHFDSADEGTKAKAADVRDKSREVAKFVLPTKGSSDPPPRVGFHWGDIVVEGIMSSYQEDLDLFSPEGTPLHSKVSISIQQQDPTLEATGPGAKKGDNATTPGSVGGAPGTIGFGASLSVGAGASLGVSAGLGIGISGGASVSAGIGDQTGIAIGGESAAEFAARMGVDPTAWRGVAAGLDSTISIDAGTEIDFSSNLSASVGVGASIGVEAGASASVEASVGLGGETETPPRAGAAPGTASGMALAAVGGVQAAVATTQVAATSAAASDAKQAYGIAAPPAAETAAEALVPPAATQQRPPLRAGDLPVAAARTAAPAAPPPRKADERATTFGYGVPLRPVVSIAADDRSGAIGGTVVIGIRERAVVDVPTTADPTQAPWAQLSAGDAGRSAADAAQQRRRPTCSCDCNVRSSCGCGCGGGC